MAELKPGKNQIDIPFAPATASLDCRIERGEEKVLFATYSLTINTTAGIEEVRRAHAPVAETGVSLDDLPAGPATLVIEFYFSRGSEEYEREVLLKSGALTVLELNEEG